MNRDSLPRAFFKIQSSPHVKIIHGNVDEGIEAAAATAAAALDVVAVA
jgi:hypothetical protein